MKYAKVAVESAAFTFDKAFDYIVPPELEAAALPGCRVTVPFGNGNRQRIGIIFELCDSTESKRPKKSFPCSIPSLCSTAKCFRLPSG